MRRVKPNGFGGVGFIKMDCEGYDAHLLKLLQPLLDDPALATRRPTIKIEWFGQFKHGPPNQCRECTHCRGRPVDRPWDRRVGHRSQQG